MLLVLALASGAAQENRKAPAAVPGPAGADYLAFDDPQVARPDEEDRRRGRVLHAQDGPAEGRELRGHVHGRRAVLGHVKPFKENFLLQMEYTGAGRAKPEPDHVDSVKVGFIGPIEPTVSVATGGKSHEESARRAHAAGHAGSPSKSGTHAAAT